MVWTLTCDLINKRYQCQAGTKPVKTVRAGRRQYGVSAGRIVLQDAYHAVTPESELLKLCGYRRGFTKRLSVSLRVSCSKRGCLVNKMKVIIKWGKKTFEDVEVDTTLPAVVFKHQIYSLTGVPPERQKIMVKGGMLKDESSWDETGVKAGQKLMLLGTADKLPEAPVSAPTFLEDLPEEQQVNRQLLLQACMPPIHKLGCRLSAAQLPAKPSLYHLDSSSWSAFRMLPTRSSLGAA